MKMSAANFLDKQFSKPVKLAILFSVVYTVKKAIVYSTMMFSVTSSSRGVNMESEQPQLLFLVFEKLQTLH